MDSSHKLTSATSPADSVSRLKAGGRLRPKQADADVAGNGANTPSRRKVSFKCPSCGKTSTMSPSSLPQEGGNLRLSCSCGHTFRARFVQRKYHTLPHPLPGYFVHRSRKNTAGMIYVDKIAHSGLKFRTVGKHELAVGDMLDLAITQDTMPPKALSLEVRISARDASRISGVFATPLPEDMDLESLVEPPEPPRVLLLETSLGRAADFEGYLPAAYGVQAATTAREALERLRHALPFNAIIAHSSFLNRQDCPECAGLLDYAASQGVPVVALLEERSDAAMEEALASGARDCIAQPFHTPSLQARLANVLQSQQAKERTRDMARAMARQSLELGGKAKWQEKSNNELLRATHDILDANEKMMLAANNRSTFMAELNHEIRNSLSIISGMSELARKRSTAGALNKYLDTIYKESDALLHLLGSVLDLSNMDARELELESFDFDLHALVKHIAEAYNMHAQRKGLGFRQHIDPAVPEYLRGDGLRLRQVLSNLVSNACKFTEEGSVSISVRLASGEQTDTAGSKVRLQFRVEDTGIGISPEMQHKIFDEQEQDEPFNARRFGGTGLGLSICKRYVELLQGDIQCESTPNAGTSFTVTVPMLVGDAQAALTTLSAPSAQTLQKLPHLRLLVVVEDKLNRQILTDMLEDDGHSITSAESAKVAMELLARSSFDMAILDGDLCHKDGNLVPRTIRDQKSQVLDHDLPLLVLSTWTSEEELNSFFSHGFNDYIPKPLAWPTIKDAMARNLRSQTLEERDVTAPLPKTRQPAPEEPVPSAPQLPHELPGLDLDDAMNRLQGRTDRFLRYLHTFLEEYCEAAGAIFSAIKQDDVPQAIQLCQALAGAASDISAFDAAYAAREVESRLADGQLEQALEALGPLQDALEIVYNGAAAPPPPVETPATRTDSSRISSHHARVLLVEDNMASQQVIQEALEAQGFTVYPASSGGEGLQIAQSRHVDIVMLDIQMPNMSGYQVSSGLRKLPNYARTPIVAMTAYNAQGVWDRCLVAGMDLLLEKPIDGNKLRSSLDKWIEFTGKAPTEAGEDAAAPEADKAQPAQGESPKPSATKTAASPGKAPPPVPTAEQAVSAPEQAAPPAEKAAAASDQAAPAPAKSKPAAATQPSQPKEPRKGDWPELPGIETQEAKERVSGQFGLFKRFLQAFYGRHENDPGQIRQAFEDKDTETLRFVAGTLLSGAANISANSLVNKAKAVERLSGREPEKTMRIFVSDMEQELEKVLQTIRELLGLASGG